MVAMSEKLSLQWHNFRDHITDTFGKLLKDNNFTDVTLACNDGKQMQAHKVVLASSSTFFKNLLLGKNAHTHPMIYMRGVKSENLEAILDFLYCGEANVLQENLETFLILAEELEMKGFMETSEESQPPRERNLFLPMKSTKMKKLNMTNLTSESNELTDIDEVKPKIEVDDAHESDVKPVIATADLFQEIDEKIKPLIIKYENRRGFSCKVCDRNGDSGTIKDHIEAKHLEGISIPCNLCKIMLKSRSSLKMHKRRNHQNHVLS